MDLVTTIKNQCERYTQPAQQEYLSIYLTQKHGCLLKSQKSIFRLDKALALAEEFNYKCGY